MYLIVPIKKLSPSAPQESRAHLQLQHSKLPSPLNFILFPWQFLWHRSVLASSLIPRRSVLFVLTPHSSHHVFTNIKHLRNHPDNPPFIYAMKFHLKRLFRRSKKQSEPSTPATPSVRKVKGAVFRVTGIPLTLSTAALEAAISAEFSVENITVDPGRTRICSSCSDQKTKVALIGFTPNSPVALDNLASAGTYEVEIRELRCDISVDRDFHELTQVYPTRGTVRAEYALESALR